MSSVRYSTEQGEELLRRMATMPKGRFLNPADQAPTAALQQAKALKARNPVRTHIMRGPAELSGRSPEARVDTGPKILRLDLPMPPSIDAYFIPVPMPGKSTAKYILGRDGKAYRNDVAYTILTMGPKKTILHRVRIDMVFHFMTRRGDIDNRVKPLWDALTFARVWHDDGQVDKDTTERGEQRTPPRVVLTITEYAGVPPAYIEQPHG